MFTLIRHEIELAGCHPIGTRIGHDEDPLAADIVVRDWAVNHPEHHIMDVRHIEHDDCTCSVVLYTETCTLTTTTVDSSSAVQ